MTPALETVKPDRILHELSELWTSLSKQEHLSQQETSHAVSGAGVLRACAMTLIAFVDDEDDSLALGETLAFLMREHPSRAIVVRLREGGDLLESRVFAQCWMPFGHNRQICCEQVELTASLNRIPDILSIISPLAAADVPRIAWFRSSRIGDIQEPGELLAVGDKLIVDSVRPGAPSFADLRVLARAGYIVGDLAWTRLTQIRELIAQLLCARDLQAIKRVEIEYAGAAPAPETKYLQAWLRSEMNRSAVDLRRSGSSGNGQVATVRIDRDFDICVEATCVQWKMGSLGQRANLSSATEQQLLSEELSIVTRDRVFERVLQRMTAWAPPS